ncbi:MAG: M20/M25/M40 family metallo-hydrolase [Pseudomonadales bacterium]|nr:M20/M25/M40 family metallo-hydrolase [Pseudomonadales bacterium]
MRLPSFPGLPPLAALLALLSLAAFAQRVAADDTSEAISRLQAYIQVDTVNPPGNESRGTEFLGKILADAGIKYETAESAPGRGNIWARLKGGRAPALVLLHHMDVVPADAKYWDVDPLSGEIRNGYVYGRGAVDTKGLGIAELQAFIALKQSGKKLNRDVIFMATADEEAGGFYGAGWMVKNHREAFRNAGYLINEGGSGALIGDTPVFRIEVTQKVPLWLRLTATDTPGHGSSPRLTSSVNRILRAGNRIAETQFERRLIPPVQAMFEASAPFYKGEMSKKLANISENVTDNDFVTALRIEQPGSAALLSNTCSITRLEGSNKINVVPPTAAMELDCRLLPDQDPDAFIDLLKVVANDPNIKFEKIMAFTPAVSSTDTPLFRAISATLDSNFPGMKIIPSVSTGFTDSHFMRDINITSYGFAPFLYSEDAKPGVHGNNERINVETFNKGVQVMTDFVMRFATEDK